MVSKGGLQSRPHPAHPGTAVESSGPRPGWQVLVFFLGGTFLCYSVAILIPFALMDDYLLLSDSLRGETTIRMLHLAGGRPTNAMLTDLAASGLNGIGDLRYLRLVSITGIGLLAWSLYRVLVRSGWNRTQSACLAAIVCTLPSFQVHASSAMLAFSALAAVASGAALLLADRAYDERSLATRGGFWVGSVVLFLLALTIYQTSAMFFWVFGVIVLFKPASTISSVLRRCLWYAAASGVGLVLGFLMYRISVTRYGPLLSNGRSSLTHDPVEKMLWFVRRPLMDALNLENLIAHPWVAVTVGILITGGLLHYFRGATKERALLLALAACIIPLSYLPNLVVAENWSSYRTQFALTSVIAVYSFLAVQGYSARLSFLVTPRALTAGLGLAAAIGILLAAYNVTVYFAVPQRQELQLMRQELARANLAQERGIYFIRPTWRDSFAPAVRYDEFGFPSSVQPWVPRAAIYVLLRERNLEPANLAVELAPLEGPAEPPPGAFVVDMRTLSRMTHPAPGSTLSAPTETFSWSEGSGVSAYWLEAGTTPGGSQIFSGTPTTQRSATVSGLPTNGHTVYIRLWSLKRNGWQCNDYSYVAAMTRKG